MKINKKIKKVIQSDVRTALHEDGVKNDITSNLISSKKNASAKIIFKEQGFLFGTHWVNEVCRQINSKIKLTWKVKDGKNVKKDQVVCNIKGNGKSILKAERTILNFLQTLSSTTTLAKKFVKKIQNKKLILLHTRKTIPGLRIGQSCACIEAGCKPHRMSLSESILIKENHLKLIDDLDSFIKEIRRYKKPIIVEAKTFQEIKLLSKMKIDRILLDNFTVNKLKKSLKILRSIPVEVSGNITLNNINQYALKGVTHISIGALTKNIHALDLSLLIQ